jgi:hypothetical protein
MVYPIPVPPPPKTGEEAVPSGDRAAVAAAAPYSVEVIRGTKREEVVLPNVERGAAEAEGAEEKAR